MRKKGFTLVEILVVIAMIGILLAIATPSFISSQKKGRDAKRKSDLKSIQTALEQYYQANKQYPITILCGNLPGTSVCCDAIETSIKSILESSTAPGPYIKKVPQDPSYPGSVDGAYIYEYLSPAKYKLVSILENNNDPDKTIFIPANGCLRTAPSGQAYQYINSNP